MHSWTRPCPLTTECGKVCHSALSACRITLPKLFPPSCSWHINTGRAGCRRDTRGGERVFFSQTRLHQFNPDRAENVRDLLFLFCPGHNTFTPSPSPSPAPSHSHSHPPSPSPPTATSAFLCACIWGWVLLARACNRYPIVFVFDEQNALHNRSDTEPFSLGGEFSRDPALHRTVICGSSNSAFLKTLNSSWHMFIIAVPPFSRCARPTSARGLRFFSHRGELQRGV